VTSAVRNTCFAILSAIETDLREIIGDLALSSGSLDILPTDVRQVTTTRFEQDNKHRPGVTPNDDIDLLQYTDFADLGKMIRLKAAEISALCGKDANFLAEAIEKMAPARNRVCHSRPLDEDDLPHFLDLSQLLARDFEKLQWRELNDVTAKIKQDPSFVFRLTIPAFWRAGVESVQHNLPLPDFDETGFIGRSTEQRDVLKHVTGPHPVISIVGEGGVGKTALAVSCLYAIIDSPEAKEWDAIVWISLKTRFLTPAGIKEIRDAIVSTVGIVQAATEMLGSPVTAPDVDALLRELRDYMERLRVILVIDNFETVSINGLRPLLSAVPKGSKVLITSRVGIGEIEVRYKLDPLRSQAVRSLGKTFCEIIERGLDLFGIRCSPRTVLEVAFLQPTAH
jgi:LuxR family transcriptional regulator, glucitol operon activator